MIVLGYIITFASCLIGWLFLFEAVRRDSVVLAAVAFLVAIIGLIVNLTFPNYMGS